MTEAAITEDEAIEAILNERSVRDVLRALTANSAPATPKKAARKQREKQVRSIVDGRSLRAKGRSAQVNIKVRPDIKQALAERVEAEGVTIADWLERMLETALERASV